MPNADGFIDLIKQCKSINSEYALEIIESSHVFEKLLRQLARSIPEHVSQMDKYIADENLTQFKGKVHGLKGVLNQAGCLDLAQLAQMLEKASQACDKSFCRKHYPKFRNDIMDLYEHLCQAAKTADALKPEPQPGNIKEFLDLLKKTRNFAADYDSISALESMTELKKHSFDTEIDALFHSVIEALEMFRPESAVKYLTEIINECNRNLEKDRCSEREGYDEA